MRLIDADALETQFQNLAESYRGSFSGVAYQNALWRVQEAPTVDAVKVVHGRFDDSFDGITPYCTICGHSHRLMTRLPNYCPNCGAKMDEERKM